MGQQVDTNYITSMLAVTKDVWKPELTDNFFDDNVLLNVIKEKSKVDIMDGGKYLQIPVMIGGNSNSSAFEYFDTIGTATQKGFVDAKLSKKHYGVTIPVSDQEIDENGGEAKVVDLVVSRIKQASSSVFSDINADMFLDGTGTSGKVITGLGSMVSETPAVGSYAGLDPATIAAWQNQYNEGAYATLIDALDTAYYSAVDGKRKPNIIVTDALGIRKYLAKNRDGGGAAITYVNASKADAGFADVKYNGIDMLLDVNAPQNTSSLPIYWLLNADKLGFYFKVGDFQKAGRTAGQFADTLQSAVTCQLYTNERRAQGKLKITS